MAPSTAQSAQHATSQPLRNSESVSGIEPAGSDMLVNMALFLNIRQHSGSGSAAGSIPSDLGSLKIAIFGNIEDPGSGAGSIPSDRSKCQYWTKSRIQRVRFLQIVLLQWTQLKSATSQGPPEGCLGPGTPPSPARSEVI